MLEGKSALVTGASRGIGKAIALELAKQGANVAVNYAGNKDLAESVSEEIKHLDRESFTIQANVSNESAVLGMVKAVVTNFGTLDVLVNDAGITNDNLLMRMKEEAFDEVININLKGVFLCMKAAARPMMRQRSGRIINVASIVGVSGNPGQS